MSKAEQGLFIQDGDVVRIGGNLQALSEHVGMNMETLRWDYQNFSEEVKKRFLEHIAQEYFKSLLAEFEEYLFSELLSNNEFVRRVVEFMGILNGDFRIGIAGRMAQKYGRRLVEGQVLYFPDDDKSLAYLKGIEPNYLIWRDLYKRNLVNTPIINRFGNWDEVKLFFEEKMRRAQEKAGGVFAGYFKSRDHRHSLEKVSYSLAVACHEILNVSTVWRLASKYPNTFDQHR